MKVVIKKNDTLKEMNRKIDKASRAARKTKPKKTFDPYQFLGKGIFKGVDGLEFQKKVRDEWDR